MAKTGQPSWTQPLCPPCWNERNPDRTVNPLDLAYGGETETCCDCGQDTSCGIYVRVDPATVEHPRITP